MSEGPRTHTFVVYVEDKPGVLNRVASLFRRRAYNIESLTVGHTERPGVSRMTIVSAISEGAAHRVEANIYKLVNVLSVAGRDRRLDRRAQPSAHQSRRARRIAPPPDADRACLSRARGRLGPAIAHHRNHRRGR